eukprot:SAG31_NODE_3267_length_4478_cov_2.996118_7_plen_250_part_00
MLTGAPCAGKSFALHYIEALLKDQGFHVLKIEEVATRFFANIGGVDSSITGQELVNLQSALLRAQIQAEELAFSSSQFTTQTSIVLCDSATLSGAAYCTPEVWNAVLSTTGYSARELASRYDLVLRLGSVAELSDDSNYDFGPGSSNPARFHTAEQARLLAPRFEGCYVGCRQLFVPAMATMEAKLRGIAEVLDSAQQDGHLPLPPGGVADSFLTDSSRYIPHDHDNTTITTTSDVPILLEPSSRGERT